jgi:hypothetical protein
METPKLPSEPPRINPWATNPTTTLRGPHYTAEYQRLSQVEFGSRPISWLQALDIIECLDPIFYAGLISGTINWKEAGDTIKSMDPYLHARILEYAGTEPAPPLEPLLISPWNITPTTEPRDT